MRNRHRRHGLEEWRDPEDQYPPYTADRRPETTQNVSLISPTTCRLMMSPKMCCCTSLFARLFTFRLVTMRSCIHFTPNPRFTSVKASVVPAKR